MAARGVTITSHLTWPQSPGRTPTHLITGRSPPATSSRFIGARSYGALMSLCADLYDRNIGIVSRLEFLDPD